MNGSMIVYTANFLGYDRHQPPIKPFVITGPGVRYVRFTDSPVPYQGWEDIEFACESGTEIHTVKWLKTHPYSLFRDHAVVWMDSNVMYLQDPLVVWDHAMGDPNKDVAFFRNKNWDSVYRELDEIKKHDTVDSEIIDHQIRGYRAAHVPEHYGMAQTSVVFYRNTRRMQRLCELWWSELQRWSMRDQASLPYVLWQLRDKVSVNMIQPGGFMAPNTPFHLTSRSQDNHEWKRWYWRDIKNHHDPRIETIL